ncbi:metallophosphoesterase [Palleronia sediminis]|uniref:Metallophosphoesterase n=1 Tax=Palleronia sediminis TaxID=2547833 RepID=A0A4V6PP32_9RHOB|nr:metallophosphoesterase [Palleronia sediminis]TDL76239.1 metallophosphoesterase [Palleronia sediminis]
MARIVHLSDLHFGRDRPELSTPLLAAVNGLSPDLVAISGDFTQRARHHQFAEAARFKARIEAPVLAVPGNHDTPLDNLWVRFLRPFSRYRKAIDPDLEPDWSDNRVKVTGVNTVNRFSWQRGRISGRTVREVCHAFADAGERLRIVVLHHPLEHGPEVDKRLMRGSAVALDRLGGCGADIVLSGHLHSTIAAPFRAAPSLLFVQAGTGLSDRLRGERNTFNVVEGDRRAVAIETWAASDELVFAPCAEARFSCEGGAWVPA